MPLGVRGRVMILIAIAILPGVLAAVSLHLDNRATQIELAEQTVVQVVEVRILRQQSQVDAAERVLLTLSTVDVVRERDGEACHSFLAATRDASPEYVDLGVIEMDGTISCSASIDPADHAAGTHYTHARNDAGFAIGAYDVAPVSLRPHLDVALPIPNATGTPLAVLYARLDLTWIYSEGLPLTATSGTVLMIVDDAGFVILRQPDPSLYVGTQREPNGTIVERIHRDGQGRATEHGFDGIERLYAFAPLPRTNATNSAYLAYGIPVATMTEAADRDFRTSLGFTLLVAIIVFTLAWTLSERQLVYRIRAMTRTAKRLASGDLDARTGLPPGHADLDVLAATLDDLAASFQRLDRTRLDLVNNTAHQIGTPLTAIRLALTTLLEQADTVTDPGAKRALDILDRNARRLSEVTRAVLDIAQFEYAKAEHEFQDVQLDEIVQSESRLLDQRGHEKGVQVQLDPPESITLRGDERWLKTAIRNLLENALRASTKGDQIQIRLQRGLTTVRISVQDTGQGIAPESLPLLFQPFGQSIESREQTQGGLGLGLYLVRRIAEHHGGSVSATSPGLGQGATFTLDLPLAPRDTPG